MNKPSIKPIQALFIVFTPILLTAYLYWPGLAGPFILDDIPNLDTLGSPYAADLKSKIMAFVFSGDSGPTGRPLSLLSFFLNDDAWPSEPWSFKYTNLMFHLLSGVLVLYLTLLIGNCLRLKNKQSAWLAGLTSAFWLIHPLNVSTVLYVIQRMTELSSLFMFAAIAGYLAARKSSQEKPAKALFYMSLSLIIFGLLAIFSKENGALLLLFVIVMEHYLLQPMGSPPPKGFKVWATIFLYVPTIFLFVYSSIYGPLSFVDRPFSMAERFLSEFRVLVDYITQIILPRTNNMGIFHDDFTISHGIFSPPSTLFSILFIISLLVFSHRKRKKYPIFSFAVMWFFAGHVMESTFFSLELYFEHRNYLPLFGPLFSLAYAITTYKGKFSGYAKAATAVYLLLLALITGQNAWMWGNPNYSMSIWADEKPNSLRASIAASQIALMKGDLDTAKKYMLRIYDKKKDNGGILLNLMILECKDNTVTRERLAQAADVLERQPYNHGTLQSAIQLSNQITAGICRQITAQEMRTLLNALLKNPRFRNTPFKQHALYYWIGMLYAKDGHLSPAVESLDKAYKYKAVVDIPLQQAIWLESAGLPKDALGYVQLAKSQDQHPHNPMFKNLRKKEIDSFESRLIKSLEKSPSKTP